MTFLELAERVLLTSQHPLSSKEIWNEADRQGLLKDFPTKGKTPEATLGSQLYTNSKKTSSRFQVSGKRPAKFSLKEQRNGAIYPTAIETEILRQPTPSTAAALASEAILPSNGFKERDLHPLLVYFANRELNCHCKTIDHTKSEKNSFGEWVHPDIVGCSFPIGQWDEELLQLSSAVENTSVKFLSFELKKELNMNKLREYFFQTVSNSSWSNEGYLVAAKVSEDNEFRAELGRLSVSFGIGVIELNTKNPDESTILFPAKTRENLDWETVNKLTRKNPDFKAFVKRVRIDVNSNEIRKELYDKVLDMKKLLLPFQ